MAKWHKTNFRGVRFYEHLSRKRGIQKDRYFTIRYQRAGERKEEGLGWASDGWTAQKAALELAKLKEAHTKGEGPTRLKERREVRREKSKKEEAGKLSFKQYFTETYYPISKISKKFETYRKENAHFRIYIEPVIGDISLQGIYPLHLERIKKNMIDANKAPRTIQYVFATIRQVWNMAKRDGLVGKESPTKSVKLPKISNARLRFLSHEEADILLEDLKTKSTQLHDITLLSLHCGLRAGETFNLTRGDVDIEHETLTLRDTKSGRTRHVFMTGEVKVMLSSLERDSHDAFVFQDRKGKGIEKISNAFPNAIKELGFNDGISDRRQKVVFHTLRHTFASWLVESGEDIYTIKNLLGHSTITVTERYSHLKQDALRNAIKNLEKSITKARKSKVIDIEKHRK